MLLWPFIVRNKKCRSMNVKASWNGFLYPLAFRRQANITVYYSFIPTQKRNLVKLLSPLAINPGYQIPCNSDKDICFLLWRTTVWGFSVYVLVKRWELIKSAIIELEFNADECFCNVGNNFLLYWRQHNHKAKVKNVQLDICYFLFHRFWDNCCIMQRGHYEPTLSSAI